MAQVAVNWVATQPGVASAIVGASSRTSWTPASAALDFELPAELRASLDEASAVPPVGGVPDVHAGVSDWIISPGVKVGDKPAGYRPPVLNWR